MRRKGALIRLISQGTASPERVRWLYIRLVQDQCGGNISATARRLGMHRRSLQRILERGEPSR